MIGWWEVVSCTSGHVGYFYGSSDNDVHLIVRALPETATLVGQRHIAEVGSGVEIAPPTIYPFARDEE